MEPIRLLELPHRDMKDLLATGAPVYVEINPVEYHGPHLPLRNDALVSQGLLRDLHARLAENHRDWPLLLATGIEAGVDVVLGPGAREATYAALRDLVLDASRALVSIGAKRVVLMTFHGGPLHNLAVHEGVRLLEEARVQAFAPLNLVTEELIALDTSAFRDVFEHVADPAERAALERDLPLDFHAGFFETSMSLHYVPAAVADCYRELPPCPPVVPERTFVAASRVAERLGNSHLAAELRYAAAGRAWYALDPFPGYTGRPAHASARAGSLFARKIVDRYVARAEEIFAGRARSPKPILRWTAAATLGGRIGRNARPEPKSGAPTKLPLA
jgi:creatinine amidohydrolase